MRSVVLDVETTGLTLPSMVELDKQPRIIELACVVLERGTIVGEHEWLINPGASLTAEIVKITGLTDADLEGKPPFADLVQELRAVFDDATQLFAHNAPFDTACLKYELQRAQCEDFPWPPEIICTVQEYVHEFGFRPKLTDLYLRKMGRPLEQKHRAMSDVRALVEILQKESLL